MRIITILLSLLCVQSIFSISLEKIRSIGSEDEENYIIYRISNAKFDHLKNIYVTDSKDFSIKKFSFDGKFIKKFGKKGKGPNEFLSILIIGITKDRIYLKDTFNKRMSFLDLNLSKIEYLPSFIINQRISVDRVLSDELFVGMTFDFADRFSDADKSKYLTLYNPTKDTNLKFFSHTPIKSNENFHSNMIKYIMLRRLRICADRESKKILLTHVYMSNPFKIFEYDFNGNRKNQVEIKLPSKYKFPIHLLKRKPEKFKGSGNYGDITNLFFYNGHYLVHMYLYHIKKGKFENTKTYLYVISRSGEVVKKIDLVDRIWISDISQDGYLLTKNWDDETERLIIYKLNF